MTPIEHPVNSKLKTIRSALKQQFPTVRFEIPQQNAPPPKLASCVEEIDAFLGGGLPFDGVTEFGMPLGREGRRLLLKFLVNATQGLQTKPIWVLWVSSHPEFSVFPPAWFAKGVAPERIFFAHSAAPAQELKRALINPFFKLIVLDSPLRFSRDDCFFVNTQTRLNHQVVILVRNFFLSNTRGNVWAGKRLNCWKRHRSGQFVLSVVRGLPARQLVIHEELLQ